MCKLGAKIKYACVKKTWKDNNKKIILYNLKFILTLKDVHNVQSPSVFLEVIQSPQILYL